MASPLSQQHPALSVAFESHESRHDFLPENWSDTDQYIFESFLLPSSTAASSLIQPPPVSTKLPGRRVSLEEKRLKHRQVQRRFMQRKKNLWTSIKQSIGVLEKQVVILQLSTERDVLEMEKKTLQAEEQMQIIPLSIGTRNALERIFQVEVQAAELQFQPLTVQQWQEIVYQTLHSVDSILTPEALIEASGRNVMGWSDRRHVENSSVKFTLHKAFPQVCAETLWNSTWQKLSTDSCGSFFSPSLFVRKHLLQKVCNDAIIIYRVICYPQTGRISRAIEVISRVRREHDFVYFVRTLDLPDVKERVCATDVWTQSLTVLRFLPSEPTCPDIGCVVQYGGNYVNIPKGGAKYWLLEVLFLVLRFESSLISPTFSLHN